jgi:hypothetical protein
MPQICINCWADGCVRVICPAVASLSKPKYRVIKKSLFTWWLQYGMLQVIFNSFLASLLGSIWLLGNRPPGPGGLTLTPSVIPNSNYVIIVSDWNRLKYFCVCLYCNQKVHRDVLITLYIKRCPGSCQIPKRSWQVMANSMNRCGPKTNHQYR